MQVGQCLRNLDRHGYHIQVRVDTLGIRALVTGNLRLWHDGIHDPALVALPGIGGPAQKGSPCPVQQAVAFER